MLLTVASYRGKCLTLAERGRNDVLKINDDDDDDDCYLIVPSVNSHLVQEELDHFAEWADVNNLKLNSTKSKEMIIRRPKTKLDDLPMLISGIERVDSMKILGVTL